MTFKVEVDDFYLDEEDLSLSLKSSIKNEVVSKIKKDVETQVNKFMDDHIKTTINEELKTRVQILMEEILKSGKIKGNYSSDPEMTVEDWIKKKLVEQKSDIAGYIDKAVKNHVSTLKTQYDMLFASQVVQRIKEAGFLKEEAAKMLLTEAGQPD